MMRMTTAGFLRHRRVLAALVAASALVPCAALAQQDAAEAAPAAAEPSESAMVNLVRALVAQGSLTAEVGARLIQQAEAEAAKARAARLASGEMPAAPPGAIRVPYVPDSVRQQIREELKTEVMAEAKRGGWASPGEAAPAWTRRIAIHGDIRIRSQSSLYADTNADDIIDYATINANSPYGIDDKRLLLPILESRNDRWSELRLRARLAIDAQVTDGVTAQIAVATGDNAGPISTQTWLGGGFLKRDLWVDKAWVRIRPVDQAVLTFGRFADTFNASELLYDDDMNFDGIAAEVNSGKWLGDSYKVTLRGGAFPFEYTPLNAPNFAFEKPKAPQKWLFAGEIEGMAKFDEIAVKLSAGYHVFHNFQGDLSAPCEVEREVFCSTDHLQPVLLSKGNTLSPLRQIVVVDPDANLPQLLGYTFAYRVLDVNGEVTIPLDDVTMARLRGSYIKNLGFDKADICRNGLAGRPYNNAADSVKIYCAATDPAKFAGGDTGWRGEIMLGQMVPRKRGEWNVFAGYRYLESDAVLDALADSEFHLGGTNSKGYVLGGRYALLDGLTLGTRYLSSNEISGPPLAIDVWQVDLQVHF